MGIEMAKEHRAKIGTKSGTLVVFRYNYTLKVGKRVTFREWNRPRDWKTGIIDMIRDGRYFISLF